MKHFFRSVPDLYAEKLVEEGILSKEEVSKITSDHMTFLNDQFKLSESYVPEVIIFHSLLNLGFYILLLCRTMILEVYHKQFNCYHKL